MRITNKENKESSPNFKVNKQDNQNRKNLNQVNEF